MEQLMSTELKQLGTLRDLKYQESYLHSYAPFSKIVQEEARKSREEKRKRNQLKTVLSQSSKESKFKRGYHTFCRRWVGFSQTEFGRKINDFLFLTILGVSVAIISVLIDIFFQACYTAQLSSLHSLRHLPSFVQYVSWTAFFIVFTCFAVGITHFLAPTAIGSGIPEVKTMLRGVVMNEYLTFKTLLAKVIGLTAALGSGLPVGKEGSFVHIGVIVAALISRLLPSFSNCLENHESRLGDILLPGSAVGLSCTFAAPVGALLYSLETTSVTFAVKNYWRSFYASAVGSLMYRLVATWSKDGEVMNALRETHLPQDKLFDPSEFVAFIFVGITAGLLGVCFILLHKHVALFMGNNKRMQAILNFNRFIFPTMVAILIATLQFPVWLGQFYGGKLSNAEAVNELSSNFTWSSSNLEHLDLEQQEILSGWQSPAKNVILTTFLFCIMRLWMCALSTTLPLPCGLIFPSLAIGAGLGRMFGEIMSSIFPYGIRGKTIVPGAYALVGSAAFAGAVTHTFSPVVMSVEFTGQMAHVLPSLVAVMFANAISRCLTSSVYDCVIEIKKLPFLPIEFLKRASSSLRTSKAKDIMVKDLTVLTKTSSYGDAAGLLMKYKFKSFPIVDSTESMVLLGSIERSVLKQVIGDQLCMQNKIEFYSKLLNDLKDSKENGLDCNANSSQSLDLEWRKYELTQEINFNYCPYDQAPVQIPSETSINKVHSIFSLLNLHHALVTEAGKLVGIISISEVRKVIEVEIEDKSSDLKDKIKSCVEC